MLGNMQSWRVLSTLFLILLLVFSYRFSQESDFELKSYDRKKVEDNSISASEHLKTLQALPQYASISEQPLFDVSRKAVAKVVQRRAIRTASQNDLRVKGLGMADGPDGLITVLKDLRSGKVIKLKLNDSFDGWVLSEISQKGFLFLKDQRSQLVEYRESQD